MFKKLITPILLLVIVNISFSQNQSFFIPNPDIIDTTNYAEYVDIGIRIEVNKVYEERMTNLGAHPTYGTVYSTYGYVFPFSLYLPFHFKVSKNLLFEFRPGIRFAGEHLTSASLGLIFHYYPIEERVYVLLGAENSKHINPLTFNAREELWNTYYQRITVFNDDKWHTSLLLGGGYEFGKIVSADISLTLPFKQEYGWHDVKDQYGTIDPPDGRYPMKLFLILKFGINFILL